jgi:hypothetical protein
MLEDTTKEYCIRITEQRRGEYKLFKPAYCPCLKETINFNADGFHHLQYKTDGRERNKQEQIYKLNLVPLIIPVIKNAKVVDEYRTDKVRIGRKKKIAEKNVEYWAITANVGHASIKTKVILRRVGDGKINFWSVMKLTKN